jgi:hypothetical protein|tara:strand:- start:1785 stop:2180 length:396 start_codon:yes stop_codon:yes gene_type:complete
MKKPTSVLVAVTPVLALALVACADTGMGRVALPNTGSYQELRTAPGPDENAVAVLSDLRKTDSEFNKLRESGQLTKREKRKLDRAQARVGLLAASYDDDGVVTNAERREMDTYSRAMQDLAAIEAPKSPKK